LALKRIGVVDELDLLVRLTKGDLLKISFGDYFEMVVSS
jgi:hypothetical protein